MHAYRIAICLFLLCLYAPSQAQAIDVVVWNSQCGGKFKETLDAGESPSYVVFPLVYYTLIRNSTNNAPRYEGYLVVNVDYDIKSITAGDDIWNLAFRVKIFNKAQRATCGGDFFCTSVCWRAPVHSWNALVLFMQELLFNAEQGAVVLTMGQQPDPSFIPQLVWNESAKRYECTNLRPGMRVLNFDDLQKSPVGAVGEQKP